MNFYKQQILSDAQLKAETDRCTFCEEKPCMQACPSHCSPADFIMAIGQGEAQDYQRAAGLILSKNPLGGICGAVCPDSFCVSACTHKLFDRSLNIPAIQGTIIAKAKALEHQPEFYPPLERAEKIAIVGAGPAGLAAAGVLAQDGYSVTLFEKSSKAGGMCRFIPDERLDKNTLDSDIDYLMKFERIEFKNNQAIESPEELLAQGFSAVLVAAGLDEAFMLPIPGVEHARPWTKFLADKQSVTGKTAIIGGGAVALDCALHAEEMGSKSIDFLCLENLSEMALDRKERQILNEKNYGIFHRFQVNEIKKESGRLTLCCQRVQLPADEDFHPSKMQAIADSEIQLNGYDQVIFAIGAKSSFKMEPRAGLFYAGDMELGASTVIQSVASGKNKANEIIHYLQNSEADAVEDPAKSDVEISGKIDQPVSLRCDFFGREILSPFLLSAAPPSDGYEQMKKAYLAGWAGGVMKTAFDGLDIHIPSEYMFVLDKTTFGNADNVSEHPLERVCSEISQLVREFPDRLTLASTGGPVTGNDGEDCAVWQSNTKKLEAAGAMGIEYSLSCPQGGDGTKGDIVSQDAELTGKIVDWVMQISDPDIPKLFKLTGAVTAIYPILAAIKKVFEKYPDKKAGVTLANTFPGLGFRDMGEKNWEEGVVIGMSGSGVTPISNLTLANASKLDLTISGNGGPMDYKAAAHFLALGAKTVQFCSVAMKFGVDIVNELHSGLSYLMAERGLESIADLIGSALPNPIRGFMDLPATKKISDVNAADCVHCGNCTRCPYLAIQLNADGIPETDPAKCIGCSFCSKNCISGALFMRERNADELAMMKQ